MALAKPGLFGYSLETLPYLSQAGPVRRAAGHLKWEVDYPPSQPVGSGFEPHWRPQPAKLPSFGGYSLETLPYLSQAGPVRIQLCHLNLHYFTISHNFFVLEGRPISTGSSLKDQ